MSKLFLILSLMTTIISSYTILINYQRMQDSYIQSSYLIKNKKTEISYRMKELKDQQKRVSYKMSNCTEDKSCYEGKSYKDQLFNLKLEAQIILSFYGKSCPLFKDKMIDFLDFVKNIETLASFESNPQTLQKLLVPNLLELKTNELIDDSILNCSNEYALNNRF